VGQRRRAELRDRCRVERRSARLGPLIRDAGGARSTTLVRETPEITGPH
jgi:hypothetical protein